MLTSKHILAALLAGKFRPMSDADREGFAGAGDDALIWEHGHQMVIVCTDGNNELTIEVHGDDDSMRTGSLTLAPFNG